MLKHKSLKVPTVVYENFSEVVTVIKSFCDIHLNNEYYDLALCLATKIARKNFHPYLLAIQKPGQLV